MEDEHIYSDDYFSSFPDPLLSRKLLKFSTYPEDKTINEHTYYIDIPKLIYGYNVQRVYYGGEPVDDIRQPVYYQGKRHSETELTQFRESRQFSIFLRELEQCITYINHWIIAQGITLELSDRTDLANHELRSIPAQQELEIFLTRLTGGNFVEFDSDLFADGKKYLEKLALLVRNNDIDITFRKNQIISLLGDEGLRRCAGGCLTVLDNAVSNLENYGDYRPHRLLKNFFLSLVKESAIYASKSNAGNAISQISKILTVNQAISEVHIYNFLLLQAKRVFNLRFLVLPEDPFVSFVTEPYDSNPVIREKINWVLENDYINPIKQKFRTADLVYFISNQFREGLETSSLNPLEKFNKLKGWLSELGDDPNFNQADFFNEEFRFKLSSSLERTVVDRLFDTRWLELDLSRGSRLLRSKHFFFERNSAQISLSSQPPFPIEAFTPLYRIYYSNIELSWIKIGEKKQRILDYIQQKGGFEQLQQFFHKSPQLLVNSLIQTPRDMSLFFQALTSEDLTSGLTWVENNLSDGFKSPSVQIVVWMDQFAEDAHSYAKILESVDLSTRKRLFLHLIERHQPFSTKLQTILNKMVKIESSRHTEILRIMTSRYETFYEIMNNLFRLDIKDFSGLEFPAFHCRKSLFSTNSRLLTYLLQIDFSGCNLDKTIFNTHIKNCEFNGASLDGTIFKKSVEMSSFKETDLTTVKFLGDSFTELELEGAKFSTDSFIALVKGTRSPAALFSGADLRQVDFQNRQIQHELTNRVVNFNNALLQNTDLSNLFKKESNIVLLDNANLDGANLSKCKLVNIHIMYTSMRGVTTDKTLLRLDQLFELHRQGNRDFSTDYITDSDPKTDLFNRETLKGAILSDQISLTLESNGFTNFDQAQLERIDRYRQRAPETQSTLLTSKTLKDRTQRVRLERLELGQRKSQELQQIISETLNYRKISKLHVLKQAELFHSYLFTQKNLEIHGQCVQLTAAFSEAIVQGRQADFKNNLFVLSEWEKRLIQHKQLSHREQTERHEFLDSLRKFEGSEDDAVRLPSWSYHKEIAIANINELISLIDFSNEFAWHIKLIEPNQKIGHVLGVYHTHGRYAYFDSNVGYVDNITDREVFISFLKRIIKKSYLIHNNIQIKVDQYHPIIGFKENPTRTDLDNALYPVLTTERNRLSIQDENLGYLVINRQLVERTQLYDIGLSYHHDGNLNLPGKLIDAEMNLKQDFFDKSLSENKFSINNLSFKEHLLKYIQKEHKFSAHHSKGKNKRNFNLEMMRSLADLPNYQMLKSSISTKSLIPLLDVPDSFFERRTRLRTIEKLLKKEVACSQLFITRLEQNQFKKGLMAKLKGIGKKIPAPKALGGLIVTKSFFDIGISLSQNNQEAALFQSLMLGYGLFFEPWLEESIIKLPKKFAGFVNRYSSTIKITDTALNAKKIVIPTRLFAGVAVNVLDIVSLSYSINKLMEAEYGSKDWRDAIADMTIDSASLLTGAAVVVYKASFTLGAGVGVILILVKMGYDGGSLLAEYNDYNLTFAESAQTFFRGSVGLPANEKVRYLRNRQDQVDNWAKYYWQNLAAMNEKLSIPIAVYGGGLGEYTKVNKQFYREKTLEFINNKIRKINQVLGQRGKIPLLKENNGDISPGISAILPYDSSPHFKENLSRIIPKKPDEISSQYLCLPAFRDETIETFKKTNSEVNFKCVNAVVILDKNQLKDPNATNYKKAVLDMEYVYDGVIQNIPDFDNTFIIYNGTTTFYSSSLYNNSTTNTFLIKTPYFSGNISLELETKSILIFEDNSDIRTHNFNLLANHNINMDVFSEKFNGDIEGKFHTRNFGLVIGRQQKQDKYNCQLPLNITSFFPMLLDGLGGTLKNPDIYEDCLNVKLHASSHYHLTVNSNNRDREGWGTATISIDADQAGVIIITPPIENTFNFTLDMQPIQFENLNLLKDSRLSYCHFTNELVINKKFGSPLDLHNLETLQIELKNYWNFEKECSNYVLYDRHNNLITPLLSNEVIKDFQSSLPPNIAECLFPQEFSLHRVVTINNHFLANSSTLLDLFVLVEVEEAIEDILYDATIIGPFELNPHLKLLSFIDVYPYDFTLTIGNSGKNILNLIGKENRIRSFYGSKDEDHYFINLHEINGQQLIKINNYDPDTSIDTLEIRANHSLHQLSIDQTNAENGKSLLFYVIDRHESDSPWPHVAVILLQNYFLSDVYQHLEICFYIEGEEVKCYIPFLDKDAHPKPVWSFKRYFRNPHNEEEFFKLDPIFSKIVVEGDISRFQAIQREEDLILLKDKKDGSTGHNSLSLWFPDYYLKISSWDLFNIYETKNATAVHSRMRDLDNKFIRELSNIAIDYNLLENNLRFYELSLTENNNVITHNQLQSNPNNRNQRDIASFLSRTEFDIGYLEISKNESFSLVDIKVKNNNNNLLFCIDMQQASTLEITSYNVTAENWNKPEYRLAGILYRQLTILDLNQWDLEPRSILKMQRHIHEKILEHQIDSVLESDLKIKAIWNKLRVFLLVALPLKGYDIQKILHFMQKTLDFEGVEEFLAFLPNASDSNILLNDIKTEIAQNESLAEKIKSLLLYHVAKASFPGQENSKQIVIDSFSMVSEPLISSIYTQMRIKILKKFLGDAEAYMKTTCSFQANHVKLSEWLDILIETSNKTVEPLPRNKRRLPSTHSGFFEFQDSDEGRGKNLRVERLDKIITADGMTSSASRSEGWLNSLFKGFIEPFKDDVQALFSINKQPSVVLAPIKDSTSHQSLVLDHCIPGMKYGDTYRKGNTCYSQNMQMLIFPKNNDVKMATLNDTYSRQSLRPVEYNGRPAVYSEGEKTHVFYIPEIPENPLDRFNDQLVLLQVVIHEAKKFFNWCKILFARKSDQSQLLVKESVKTFISNEIKTSWKERLESIQKQFNKVNRLAGGKIDLVWINSILKDRKEEFNHLNQLSHTHLEIINAFTENLQALQSELLEIEIDLNLTDIVQYRVLNPTINVNRLSFKHHESRALLSLNKSKATSSGFFNPQSCKENTKLLGFDANNRSVNII